MVRRGNQIQTENDRRKWPIKFIQCGTDSKNDSEWRAERKNGEKGDLLRARVGRDLVGRQLPLRTRCLFAKPGQQGTGADENSGSLCLNLS